MTKTNILLFLICFVLSGCGQSSVSKKNRKASESKSSADTISSKQFQFDTTRIAILTVDSANSWLFKDAASFRLTNQDFYLIEKLITDCIKAHNYKEGGKTNPFEYIDLEKYKRQYVPLINSNGEKVVYINCFCISDYVGEFKYWKKILVDVDDGGSCFFHVMINLTAKKYEQLYTNGYG